ncbi:MAG: hypothetical protein HC838_04225 [Spirulinaceae cyanobacterium RM2_2_10]|nr:hypothetical protein [Spirulinaceae cyanobacterium RM2_2_10]
MDTLQALTRRLEAPEHRLTSEKKRLWSCNDDALEADTDAQIEFLEAQEATQKQRLQQYIQAYDHLAEKQTRLTSINVSLCRERWRIPEFDPAPPSYSGAQSSGSST